MKKHAQTALWLIVLCFAAPSLAAACPMCTSAQNDEVQRAFIVGSIFLSVTPLALVGGIVLYVRRRARQLAAEEAAGVRRLPRRA